MTLIRFQAGRTMAPPLASFLRLPGWTSKSYSRLYQTGAHMTDQYCFETTDSERRDHPGRVRGRSTRGFTRNEMRKQTEIENNRTAAARIQSMIATLERAICSLDGSIDARLQTSQVRDPSSFAYPVAARAMGARRDNIWVTIAVLSQQLAKIPQAGRR